MADRARRVSVGPIARAPATDHPSPGRLAFALDGVAAVTLAAFVVVVEVRGELRGPDDGFFADPLLAILALAVLVAAIAAGAIAAWALARGPERRWLLLIPLVIGVAALAFFLGDLIVPAE